jgi:hypothetical protein
VLVELKGKGGVDEMEDEARQVLEKISTGSWKGGDRVVLRWNDDHTRLAVFNVSVLGNGTDLEARPDL